MRGASRQINSPFLLREDVGVLGVLSGNWGGSSRGLQGQVDIDLRSAPVAVLMLQESHPELVEALGQGPSDGAPGWDPNRTRDGGLGWETRWLCVRGPEHGNSLLVACRATMATKITRLLWRRRADGRYKDNKCAL